MCSDNRLPALGIWSIRRNRQFHHQGRGTQQQQQKQKKQQKKKGEKKETNAAIKKKLNAGEEKETRNNKLWETQKKYDIKKIKL